LDSKTAIPRTEVWVVGLGHNLLLFNKFSKELFKRKRDAPMLNFFFTLIHPPSPVRKPCLSEGPISSGDRDSHKPLSSASEKRPRVENGD